MRVVQQQLLDTSYVRGAVDDATLETCDPPPARGEVNVSSTPMGVG